IEGTCGWLFESPTFQQWLAGPDFCRPPFCIAGPEGMGKSYLAAATFQYLEQHSTSVCVSHFYFREQSPELGTVRNAIVTIINQVAEQDVSLGERLNLLISRDDFVIDMNSWRNLAERLLFPLFPESSSQSLYVVLDGVDKLNKERQDVVAEFSQAIWA